MTVLDQHVKELDTALQKVLKWPYKKEREEVLLMLVSYVAERVSSTTQPPSQEESKPGL